MEFLETNNYFNLRAVFNFFVPRELDRRGAICYSDGSQSRDDSKEVAMSEHTERRPAHMVIMEMIHESYRDLAFADEGQEEQHAVRIRTLCQVMTQMIIPEDARVQLVGQLESASGVRILADVAALVQDDILRLMGRLMYDE